MFLRIAILSSVISVAACTTVEFSPAHTNAVHKVQVSPSEVKVFRSDYPKQPYAEIGLVHLKGSGSLSASIDAMKEKAAAQGGNAIIDLKIIPGGYIGTVILVQ